MSVLLPFLLLAAAASPACAAPRPNFVVLILDDQDLLLGGTSAMPTLASRIVGEGLGLTGYVDVPICCPSRTSTLSGLYAHNLNDTREGWCGDFYRLHAGRTWIHDLRAAGYATALVGKMTNDYADFCGGNVRTFPDFSYASILCSDNKYFANAFNENGTMRYLDNSTYLTNYIGNTSLAWLASAAAAAATTPFFAYIAPHAPHVPATPAHEYENAPLPGGAATAPRTPNWNVGTAHHHWLVSEKAPLSPALVNYSDQRWARRLRSTMSVDDVLAAVVAQLERAGVLEDTYILYTSDHGYSLGGFRLPSGKFQVFEHNTRVPFYVRGPGVTAGVQLPSTLVNNVDIGATILDLAGVQPSRVLDGRSFASQLTAAGRAATPWPRDRLVLEYWGQGYTERGPCHNGTTACPGGVQALEDAPSNSFAGLRVRNDTHDLLYAEYRPSATAPVERGSTNWTFAVNMTADPFQLVNAALHWPADLLARLSEELWSVANCAGASCP